MKIAPYLHSRARSSAARGFTLIELLVVIAIIAILASILFPVFARARENARRSSCQSNMKQIGLGVMQYVQDYDGVFPLVFQDNDGSGGTTPGTGEQGWAMIIQPYVKSYQVFHCPSDTTNKIDPTAIPGNGYTYAYNRMLAFDYDTAGTVIPTSVKDAALTLSTQTILSFENNGTVSTSAASGGGYCTGGGIPPLRTPVSAAGGCLRTDSGAGTGVAQRHLEGSNFAFCDGHVKWVKGRNDYTPLNVQDGLSVPRADRYTFGIN